MLGHFLNKFRAGRSAELKISELKSLTPGTCLVAIEDVDQVETDGIPGKIQFGIWVGNDKMLVQKSLTEDWNTPVFIVAEQKISASARYYEYEAPYGTADKAKTLQRAQAALNTVVKELRSFPGDDFVDECVTGKTMLQLMESVPQRVGQHWWTPLQLPAMYIVRQFQDELEKMVKEIEEEEKKSAPAESGLSFWRRVGQKVKEIKDNVYNETIRKTYSAIALIKSLPDSVKTPMVEHHAIMLEANQIVHYSKDRIRLGLFREFCDMTPDSAAGGPASGDAQISAEVRLITRNRALMAHCLDVITPGYRGKFSLMSNNTEHFCRACRSNKAESLQVRYSAINAVVAIVTTAASLIPYANLVPSNVWKVAKCKSCSGNHASFADLQLEQL